MNDIPRKKKSHILITLIAVIFLYCILQSKFINEVNQNTPLSESLAMKNNNHYVNTDSIKNTTIHSSIDAQLMVHFIDVGDADSILIQQGNNSMLIDTGNNKDSDIILEYLNKHAISKLDILVGTHIHEDHIGSMDSVIDKFNIGNIYMPKSDKSNKDLEDVLLSIKNKNLEISEASAGLTFKIGDAICNLLAPNSMGYEKINDYSIVIKLQYGNTSFLFCGDAESTSEKEMMRRGIDLSADVLKLGHHGSASSTSKEFLNRVNPKYAVLTAGQGNKYYHPHKSTMNRLKDKSIKVYRTDESGTIIAVSDGQNISFNKKTGSYSYKRN